MFLFQYIAIHIKKNTTSLHALIVDRMIHNGISMINVVSASL